jgi:antitoxin VapB
VPTISALRHRWLRKAGQHLLLAITKSQMLEHMPFRPLKTAVTERHASLFRHGRDQAVRIPQEFEMEGTEVLMRKEGDRLILTPIRKSRLLDLLASWEPLDERLPDVEDAAPQARDAV